MTAEFIPGPEVVLDHVPHFLERVHVELYQIVQVEFPAVESLAELTGLFSIAEEIVPRTRKDVVVNSGFVIAG